MSDTAIRPEPTASAPEREVAEAAAERPIWEVIAEYVREIPEDELDRIPHDGSVNHDHYLYGAPRKEG